MGAVYSEINKLRPEFMWSDGRPDPVLREFMWSDGRPDPVLRMVDLTLSCAVLREEAPADSGRRGRSFKATFLIKTQHETV